jgi:hypothetical protein
MISSPRRIPKHIAGDSKCLKLPTPGDRSILSWNTVVGMLADARTESLVDSSVPQIYLSLYQRTAKSGSTQVPNSFSPLAFHADAPLYIPGAKTRIPAELVTCEHICDST